LDIILCAESSMINYTLVALCTEELETLTCLGGRNVISIVRNVGG